MAVGTGIACPKDGTWLPGPSQAMLVRSMKLEWPNEQFRLHAWDQHYRGEWYDAVDATWIDDDGKSKRDVAKVLRAPLFLLLPCNGTRRDTPGLSWIKRGIAWVHECLTYWTPPQLLSLLYVTLTSGPHAGTKEPLLYCMWMKPHNPFRFMDVPAGQGTIMQNQVLMGGANCGVCL